MATPEPSLEITIRHLVAAQRIQGLLDIIPRRTITPLGAGQNLAEQGIRQIACIAWQVPLQHKPQRLHLAAITQPATEPVRPIRRIWHLSLPQGHQRIVQVAFIQTVGKTAAGAAAIKAENQAWRFRRAPVLVRPQVQPAVITMYSRPLALHGIAFRPPDQRTIGKQPDGATFMARHGGLHGVEQLLTGQLLTEVERRRISNFPGQTFKCRHKLPPLFPVYYRDRKSVV